MAATDVDGAVDDDAHGTALPPALVLGADTVTGLAVARALRREGVQVVGLAVDPCAPACRSSAWRCVVAVRSASAQGWLDAMSDLPRTYGRMVLIPARDDTVAIVGEHASALREHFDLVLPGPDVVSRLLDKTEFHRWAEEQGLPVPRTEVVTDAASLASGLARIRYPAVLKPYERTAEWQRLNRRRKAFRLDGPADIDAVPFPLFDVAPRYVLQEWIPGFDSDVYFCLVYRDRNGHELGHQVGRKLLQWPVDAGNTVVCVTAEDPELLDLTRKVLDAAGAVGLASLEVKRSRTDELLYITEPTVGRPNLQSGVATAAGTNLLVMAYRDAAGLAVAPATAPGPAVWVHEPTLPLALYGAVRLRRLDLRSLVVGLCGRGARGAAFGARGDYVPLRRELLRYGSSAIRFLRRNRR